MERKQIIRSKERPIKTILEIYVLTLIKITIDT